MRLELVRGKSLVCVSFILVLIFSVTIVDVGGAPDRDVAVTQVSFSHDDFPIYVVNNGTHVYIDVIVANEGTATETFDVSVLRNETSAVPFVITLIGTKTVTNLAPGKIEKLSYTWDTSGINSVSTFTISANATILSGEVDTDDNYKIALIDPGLHPWYKVPPNPQIDWIVVTPIKVQMSPSILVDPNKGVGATITVNINAVDVPELKPVYGFGFDLRFAGSVLEASYALEGPWLKDAAIEQGAIPPYTIWTMNVVNEEPDPGGKTNYVFVSDAMLAAPIGAGAIGSGRMCNVTFVVEAKPGKSAFALLPQAGTLFSFADYYRVEIPNTIEGGYFSNVVWAGEGNVNHDLSVHKQDYIDAGLGYDNEVTIIDVDLMARAMGTDDAYPAGIDWNEWNIDCDLDENGAVNIIDLVEVGINYGQPW